MATETNDYQRMSNRDLLLEFGQGMAVAALEAVLLGPDGEPAQHIDIAATYDRRQEIALDLARISAEYLDESYEDDFDWQIERYIIDRMGGERRAPGVRRFLSRAIGLGRTAPPAESH